MLDKPRIMDRLTLGRYEASPMCLPGDLFTLEEIPSFCFFKTIVQGGVNYVINDE